MGFRLLTGGGSDEYAASLVRLDSFGYRINLLPFWLKVCAFEVAYNFRLHTCLCSHFVSGAIDWDHTGLPRRRGLCSPLLQRAAHILKDQI